jgi:hypothetical protein
MEFTEIFELYKKGSIAKGSNVMVSGYDKVQKIHAIDNVDEDNTLFTFTLYNNDEIFQSADIVKFISEPHNDVNKRIKNSDLIKQNAVDIVQQPPQLADPISFSLKEKENFVTIQPKVLDYLSKRLSNKRDKCPIVDECIKLLNQFQDNGNKNDLADTIIKLSQKLNDLL